MEIISSILKWSFEPDPRDLKHQGILHPIFALFFGVSFNALASYSASKFLMRYDAFKKERLPRWGRIYVKKFLIFYVFFMIISRYLVMGYRSFYEILWACNGSLINLAIGLHLDFPLLIVACLLNVAVDQTLWYLDLASYLFRGTFTVGVMNYLTWPQTSWIQIITSTHHLWYIPLCYILLLKTKKLQFEGFLFSAYIVFISSILARFIAPKEIIYENGISWYLNVNSIWDSWKDVKDIYFCSLYDSTGPGSLDYFLYVQFFWNSCNFAVYLGFYLLHELLNRNRKEKTN